MSHHHHSKTEYQRVRYDDVRVGDRVLVFPTGSSKSAWRKVTAIRTDQVETADFGSLASTGIAPLVGLRVYGAGWAKWGRPTAIVRVKR